MIFSPLEINQTRRMFHDQNLDVRTITLGISLLDCVDRDYRKGADRVYRKICRVARQLVPVTQQIREEYGIPIVHTRVSVTPISLVVGSDQPEALFAYAQAMDKAAEELGIDFIGGFTSLVHKGATATDTALIRVIPRVLSETRKVCASLNLASTQAGIHMDAVALASESIVETAARSKGEHCARLVVFANAPEDNPFMAGAFHGIGEADAVIHVGVSGPGVVHAAVKDCPDMALHELAEVIKKISFQITRVGQLVVEAAAQRLQIAQGIVDLSLAPTPAAGDSIARILESMGLEAFGAPGTTAALALLNTAMKKGGIMAGIHIGGLSGSFIPVSEDEGIAEAVERGSISLEKLEALTSVCSVGLDMVVIPGDTPVSTIAGIIADEMAIGVINHKTTAVRIIPAIGKKSGDWMELGGLLGRAPVMPVSSFSSEAFIRRGGRISAPITAFRN